MMGTKLGRSVFAYLTIFQMVITFLWICIVKELEREQNKKAIAKYLTMAIDYH